MIMRQYCITDLEYFFHAGLLRLSVATIVYCIQQFPEALHKCYKQTKTHNLGLLRFSSWAPNKQETLQSILQGGIVTDEGFASNKNEQFIEVKSRWWSCAAAGSGLI